MARRFVCTIDAAAGDFDGWFEADEAPRPVTIDSAPTLHVYMRSFMQEVFDWQRDEGKVALNDVADASSAAPITVLRENRELSWGVKVYAQMQGMNGPQPVFGTFWPLRSTFCVVKRLLHSCSPHQALVCSRQCHSTTCISGYT